MRTAFIIVFILLLYTTTTPSVQANVSHASLYQQISLLQAEIARLAALIEAREQAYTHTIYESAYYTGKYDGVYSTTATGLRGVSSIHAPRITHGAIWQRFESIVGPNTARNSIDEFRVFSAGDSALGAFVEVNVTKSTPTNPYWVLGVNDFDYNASRGDLSDTYDELLIHEYAHILLYEVPTFQERYKAEFWNRNDTAHQLSLENMSYAQLEDSLESYHERNRNRFVSDYATLNPDEDMAETFTTFVLERKPDNTDTLIDEKINYFYRNSIFTEARNNIRHNLGLD